MTRHQTRKALSLWVEEAGGRPYVSVGGTEASGA